MTKKELRGTYLEKRNLLTQEENELISTQIKQQLFGSFIFNRQKISLFLPIKNKNELDTYGIWTDLMNCNCEVYVPLWNQESNTLTHYLFTDQAQLSINQYGIPEPNTGQIIANELLDIVLVPLLTFDKFGYRVGYGKGVYDRFLIECKENTLFIGLSQFDSMEEIDDLNDFDIPLHYCITPNNVYQFEKQS
jgi:5-formyltetrahydrofolate cyclo-ligase